MWRVGVGGYIEFGCCVWSSGWICVGYMVECVVERVVVCVIFLKLYFDFIWRKNKAKPLSASAKGPVLNRWLLCLQSYQKKHFLYKVFRSPLYFCVLSQEVLVCCDCVCYVDCVACGYVWLWAWLSVWLFVWLVCLSAWFSVWLCVWLNVL